MHLVPTAVCTLNAKSSAGVYGKHLDVLRYIHRSLSARKDVLKSCKNPVNSCPDLRVLPVSGGKPLIKSALIVLFTLLYFQCAARSFSAISFIRFVRICNFNPFTLGPITQCAMPHNRCFGIVSTSHASAPVMGLDSSVIRLYTFQQSFFLFGR